MDKSPFRKLPPELRNRIWALVLAVDGPISLDRVYTTRYLALTRTCSEIRIETHSMFFALNHFIIGLVSPSHQYHAPDQNDPRFSLWIEHDTSRLTRSAAILKELGYKKLRLVKSMVVYDGPRNGSYNDSSIVLTFPELDDKDIHNDGPPTAVSYTSAPRTVWNEQTVDHFKIVSQTCHSMGFRQVGLI